MGRLRAALTRRRAQIRGYPTIKAFYNGRELSTHQARVLQRNRGLGTLLLTRLFDEQGQRELAPLKGFVASSLRSAGK